MSSIILSPKKIARLLFMEQVKWTMWFLSFMFVIYIVVVSFASGPHSSFIDLTNFSNGSSGIYMLVIGILTTSSFFYYYMQQGAARKNFFLGTIISSVLIAITITVILILLTFILQFISGWVGWNIHGQEVDFTSSFSAFIYIFVKLALMHLIYFLIGWMIGLTFYRLGWLYGLLSIACSIILLTITGILIDITHFSFFTSLPAFIATPLTIVLIVLLFGVNYRLIKDVTVKI
ncbi:hypothetical protein [Oceanobacillus neutriphilus]|uniref:ABC transporter permease n=1 Tax=Oceanobacillus neutriphilus TaxID=531815 RepID=A0ABQ2NXL2_9BACI|nr:hypothetical protein [Oceanobacillus neutriphilus]GGP13144.1 hypothetical protein GCM10011346_31940 [Oceanobacillus neutriphilus]